MFAKCVLLYLCWAFTGGQCEGDWELYENHCYLVVSEQLNHADAQSECEKLGASLASISDYYENAFLKDL